MLYSSNLSYHLVCNLTNYLIIMLVIIINININNKRDSLPEFRLIPMELPTD
jgi:hypothetical protein